MDVAAIRELAYRAGGEGGWATCGCGGGKRSGSCFVRARGQGGWLGWAAAGFFLFPFAVQIFVSTENFCPHETRVFVLQLA